MKAIIYTKYGTPDNLQLVELDKPTPMDDEVLIRVRAAAINSADWRFLVGSPFLIRFMGYGLLKPKYKVLGSDIAGQVEAVGRNVKLFKPGDEVFGDLSEYGLGGFAEYVCANEKALVLKPSNISFEEAAATPMAAVTALQGLRDKGRIQSGQKVLINGASGGVGTFAVQIAKSFGAEVTAVCSPRNIEVAHKIGSDYVIDYSKEDFTKNRQLYDLIIGVNGYHPILDYKRSLSSKGTYVMTGGTGAQLFQGMLLGPLVSMKGRKKMDSLASQPKKEDLEFIKKLLESGKISPVIDRAYTLSETPEALRYFGEKGAKGKVIITM